MLRVQCTAIGKKDFVDKVLYGKIPSSYENVGERGRSYLSRFRPIITQALEQEGICNECFYIEDVPCINQEQGGNKFFITIDDEGDIITKAETRKKLAKIISERIFILLREPVRCVIRPAPPESVFYQMEELLN
jgi:hypothetical protein